MTELIFLAERVLYRYCFCFFKSFCSCVFHVFCFGFCFACETELLLLLFFVRAQIIFCLLSLRQEFGKRILRGAAFLLETVGFDCKEVVCSFHCGEDTL